jgi:hypothetical protein
MAKNKKVNEGLADQAASAEADHELQMARSQLYKIAQYSIKLHEMMKQVTDPNGIEAWQAAKITKAADYMGAVYHDLEYKIKFEQEGGELVEITIPTVHSQAAEVDQAGSQVLETVALTTTVTRPLLTDKRQKKQVLTTLQ